MVGCQRRSRRRRGRQKRLSRTLESFFERRYLPARLHDGSDQTVRQYRIVIRQFSQHLGRPAEVADLQAETVGAFLRSRAADWADSTRRHRRAELLALARFAREMGLLRQVPLVKRIRAKYPQATAWSVEDIGRIIEAARAEPGRVARIRADRYWPALIEVLYWTGLRIGAALAIRCGDCDLAGGRIFVRGETQKHGEDQRLRIPPAAIRAIAEIWSPPRELLFPWPFCQATLYATLCRILRRAGLPCTYRDKFQRFRRTTATLCQQYGVDPTAQLGHSSDAVTRRHYLSPDAGPQAGDVLPDPTAPSIDDRPPPAAEPVRLQIYPGA